MKSDALLHSENKTATFPPEKAGSAPVGNLHIENIYGYMMEWEKAMILSSSNQLECLLYVTSGNTDASCHIF